MKVKVILDADLIERLKELAKAERAETQKDNDSLSQYINDILKKHIKKNY